ncbi:MAG: large-conductance mechanosensitive channel protein MscL [Chloroflexi bacterium]|nr:large-conductance mechanosensitive channel protein MscL [Chloroflexota bacterium]MBU1749431.1 large-conductance mechanosensitive channel protein MscL [Chloroflexota bacterium]
MLKEFKAFAVRGNVIDMAVGIIMGTAFGAIVSSLVKDIIMPPVGLLLGGVDFQSLYWLLKDGSPAAPYASLADAQAAGAVTVNYGAFINLVITFLIVTVVMFFLVRAVIRLQQADAAPPAAPTTRECPYCLSAIPIKARRCAYCTSELEP